MYERHSKVNRYCVRESWKDWINFEPFFSDVSRNRVKSERSRSTKSKFRKTGQTGCKRIGTRHIIFGKYMVICYVCIHVCKVCMYVCMYSMYMYVCMQARSQPSRWGGGLNLDGWN